MSNINYWSKGPAFKKLLDANNLWLELRDGTWRSNDLSLVATLFDAYDPTVDNALAELERLDEYFTRPRVIEDAMRGIITTEHQEAINQRDELRAIVATAAGAS